MTAPIELHWVQRPGSKPGGIIRPSTVEEAAAILAAQPSLRPIAGGTDLLLDLARDQAGDRVDLLDLTGIEGFKDVELVDGELRIGAGVTHSDIVAAPELSDNGLLALRQACLEIGSPQLRNRATIAGNLVTASPANDTISALIALNASVECIAVIEGQEHRRTIKLDEFYDGFRSTVLGEAELVTAITVPAPTGNRRGIWVKAGLRKAQAISVVHAGLVLELDAEDTVVTARIALGSVGPTVALSQPAADAIIGKVLDEQTISDAASAAVDSVQPIDDGRATAAYRQASVHTVVSRGLRALANNQHEDRWPDRVPLLSTRTDRSVTPTVSASPVAMGAEVSVSVNGVVLQGVPSGSGTLLDWLRDAAGPGTKEGCAEGECGACTVQMDGDAVMSCLVPAVQADGATVTTVEAFGTPEAPSAMQRSFIDLFAVQCGYCIPGFIVAAETLAAELDAVPTREEVELALSGNLCRCTGYYNIIDAVVSAIAASAQPEAGEQA